MSEVLNEQAEEVDSDLIQKVNVRPHPLGGIGVAVWDREKSLYIEQRIELADAAILQAHLDFLVTMEFNKIYAQQNELTKRTSGLYTPPGSV